MSIFLGGSTSDPDPYPYPFQKPKAMISAPRARPLNSLIKTIEPVDLGCSIPPGWRSMISRPAKAVPPSVRAPRIGVGTLGIWSSGSRSPDGDKSRVAGSENLNPLISQLASKNLPAGGEIESLRSRSKDQRAALVGSSEMLIDSC